MRDRKFDPGGVGETGVLRGTALVNSTVGGSGGIRLLSEDVRWTSCCLCQSFVIVLRINFYSRLCAWRVNNFCSLQTPISQSMLC